MIKPDKCHPKSIEYSHCYDCYYCTECNEWTEEKCTDCKCGYCDKRPLKPSLRTLNEKRYDDPEGKLPL